MLPSLELSGLHIDGLLMASVSVSLAFIFLVVCCAGAPKEERPKPQTTRQGAPKASAQPKSTKPAAENVRPVPKTQPPATKRQQDPGAAYKGDHGYLNAQVPIIPERPDLKAIPRYFNVPAGSNEKPDRFKPIRFSLKEAIGTLKRDLEKRELEEKRLTLLDVVGKGEFGLVYKGILVDSHMKNPRDVAVKTVHGDGCAPQDLKAFLEEVMRMCGFDHVHVQTTLGLVIRDEQPYAILPFMENGDLRSLVLSPERSFRIKNLLELGMQVALGMEYLVKQKFVHRDLAARNCMVSKDLVVKVADFGLSRDIFGSDYYRMKNTSTTPLPVRWMAPESLADRIYTTRTDIWSFGVVLWELLTRGMTPYHAMSSTEAVEYVRSGKRLEAPAGCPTRIHNLMKSCWNEDATKRPSFTYSVRIMNNLLTSQATSK